MLFSEENSNEEDPSKHETKEDGFYCKFININI